MKYGAMNFPIKPVLEELEDIAALGFDYLELAMDPPNAHWSTITQQKQKFVKALSDLNMGIVCHMPTFVYTADLTPSIREASINEVIQSLETAADLGAKKAVVHPSLISGMGAFVMEQANPLAVDFIGKVVERSRALGLTPCVENMFPRYRSYVDPEDFLPLFDAFPDLSMTFDTGHANIDDQGTNRIQRFLKKFPNRIKHVHVSDNKGQYDDHFAVGEGTVDFKGFVKTLKQMDYNDTITLEVFGKDRNKLTGSRKWLENKLK